VTLHFVAAHREGAGNDEGFSGKII
jgi:hypothetical protein